MKTIEIIGYNRANLGKSESKRLREQGMVPCVVYGGDKQVHFYSPMILFRDLVYTAEGHFVKLNIEGELFDCIMQDIQFHPVSETILHVDFLRWFAGTPIKMSIPVHLAGKSPGVAAGGTLIHKRRMLMIKSLPKNMPEFVEVDLSKLDFGKAVKVGHIPTADYDILDAPQASIAVVEIPRAMRGKAMSSATDDEEETVEAAAE